MKIKTKNLEKSEVEIIGTLESNEFEKFEDKALLAIGEGLELPGFRKGKAPVSKIKETVPEMELLEEMAERAISDAYPKILEENKIEAIGRPQITITKIGKGADLEFKIITAVIPEIKMPDYKKIAKEQNSREEFNKEVVVEDKEVEKTILELRKMRAEQKVHEGLSEEDQKNHKHPEIKEEDYPPFDDEFAKSFGNFKTAEEFKEKIQMNMKTEKETIEKDKLRMAIIEEILKKTEGEIPEILIQSEIEKILYRLQADIAQAGFKFEDYLKQINKTEEDLRKEWKPEAEKRAKLQIVIQKISQQENLKPTNEEIEKDVENVLKMYKEADPARARAYVEQMLENEKVFKFLEKQK